MDENDDHGGLDFNRKERYGVDGEILLIAVACLFSVIIVVTVLHLYARCVLQRRARQRLAIRQLRMGVIGLQMNSSEPPRTGLDAAVIASLPIFVYKQVERADNASIECSVCLSVLEEEEMARILPNCKHMFHAECIDIWLGAHSTCPICRMDAEPRAQPEPIVVNPTAPAASNVVVNPPVQRSECASDSSAQSAKVTASTSRLSSFRRMLSRDRSERRVQTCEDTDLERQ